MREIELTTTSPPAMISSALQKNMRLATVFRDKFSPRTTDIQCELLWYETAMPHSHCMGGLKGPGHEQTMGACPCPALETSAG